MPKKKNSTIFFAVLLIALFLFSASYVLADEQFKPYLHKAVVPEHPKVKLYGTYSTELFPGAATYTYPLDLPPGTNGLQPILALSYNSQSVKQRPGILGAGWSLTSTYVFRNANSTLNDTSDDSFKLILNGAAHDLVYNTSDGFYHTKIETYMRAQNLSTTSNDYGTYWLVTTKDGTKYTLGNYTSSELTSNTGRNYTVRWSLDEIKDTYGNNISYTYSENPNAEDNGTVYLNKILYNSEQSRKAEFSYETSARPDMRLVYEQGNTLEESRRLIRINISVNGNLLRSYDFKYVDLNPGNGSSFTSLANISFLGSQSSELHSVQFTYYNATHGFTKYTDSWVTPDFFQKTGEDDPGLRHVDVNNDGLIDVVKGNEAYPEKKVWINNGTGWVNQSDKWNLPLYIVNVNYTDKGVRFVDLNSDNLADIIQSYSAGSVTKVAYLNNGSGWVEAPASWNSPVIFTYKTGASTASDAGANFIELNGDGKIDLIYANNGDKRTFLNNGSGWTEISSWISPANFIVPGDKDNGLRVVDLNSDGLDDLILAENQTGNGIKAVWLNSGSGWTTASPRWLPPTIFAESLNADAGVRFADVNGDGLTDMWHSGNDGDGVAKKIWLNNGTSWTLSPDWVAPEKFMDAGKNVGRRLADVNGDGLPDLINSFDNGTHSIKHVWLKNATVPSVLRSIKTELGANITINYQNSTFYNNTNTSGISQLGYNILVVSSVVQNNTLNSSFNTISNYSYNYTGGKYDSKDREFRGFGTVTETMPDGTVVKHSFLQDAILKGKENRTEIYDNKGNLYSAQENTYNYTQTGSQFSVFLTSAASYTYDGAATNPKVTNTTYTYDSYGNVATKTQLGDTSISGDERLERYEYVYNTSAWILNTPAWYRLFAADNTTRLRETKYIYDNSHYGVPPSKGSVTSVQSWLDTGQNYQTESQYGSRGELTSETDSLGRTTKYTYESTKTFPTTIINPLGQPTHVSYDLGTGNLLWSEKNGIRTIFEYDTFGRIVKEIQPYDSSAYPTKSYTYQFDGTAPENIKVSQKTTANKTLDTYYFYDGFGQVVQIKTPATDNQQVVKNIFYDGSGRVKSEQNPYFAAFSTTIAAASATEAFTNYTYDTLDRVTNVTFPDFTNITAVFDHWTVSAYDQNGHRKDYYLDAYDRITKITEFNIDPVLNDGVVYTHNTTYGYDASDQLREIVDAYGNNYTFTYDSLGRRTRLNDPDIGEWNYTYDIVGNLISQAGGGGNLISGDGFYREYNTLNQLVRIRNGSNSSGALVEEYTYDPYGQRVKIWRNDSAGTVVYTPFRELMQVRNSSGVYNYSYIYDGSVLVARVNPDGSKNYYHPDQLGSTTLITNSAAAVVENTYYEPFGAVTSGGTSDVKLYTGQYSDTATGQYYYGTRYYDPSKGKFVQCDKIKPDIYNPQALNCYAYTYNNPYKYVDAQGNFPVIAIAIWGIFALMAFDDYNEDPSLTNAALLPISVIPEGGAAAKIVKGAKAADKAADATKAVKDISNAAKTVEKAQDVKWTPHNYKHFPSKDVSWKKTIESTKKGPAKYSPETNVEELERTVWESGEELTEGEKYVDFGKTIGASQGKETSYVLVRKRGNTIHGQPISRSELDKKIKKKGGKR